jgi:GNAT superfamily N-acetyltransferase
MWMEPIRIRLSVVADGEVYELDDTPDRVDRDAVWEFLSHEAYWGRWRSRADVERQIAGAWRVVGCYRHDGGLVGFARAVSDGVAVAYLADVFVVAAHRGHGLGGRLVRTMIDEGPGADFRWLLHTADAHDLYRPYGFAKPDHTLLERPVNFRAEGRTARRR